MFLKQWILFIVIKLLLLLLLSWLLIKTSLQTRRLFNPNSQTALVYMMSDCACIQRNTVRWAVWKTWIWCQETSEYFPVLPTLIFSHISKNFFPLYLVTSIAQLRLISAPQIQSLNTFLPPMQYSALKYNRLVVFFHSIL